jgi:hypothetical protein
MFTVEEITSKKPMLEHLPDDVIEVEKTLRELDDGYRFFYNHKKRKYEVHNLNNIGVSRCLVAEKLDGRIVKRVYNSYVPYHGDELDKMDEYNEMIEKAKEKAQQDKIEDIKKDIEKPAAKDLMRMETHSSYENFHIMPSVKEGEKNDRTRDKSIGSTKDTDAD